MSDEVLVLMVRDATGDFFDVGEVVTGDLRAVRVTDPEVLALLEAATFVRELTERMMSRAPQQGYRLWLDTADADHIYVLEAPDGSASTDTGFQGVRIPKDGDGNPLGEVEVNTAGSLTFDNRTTDGGW